MRVVESHVDQKIVELELKTPNNYPWEQRHHGCSTSSVVHYKDKGSTKKLFQKGGGSKIVICTELCMTKNITYIPAYKIGLDRLIKWWVSLKMTDVNVTSLL